MKKTCCIILAAGDGKRMKSQNPKVLCEVLFDPMILWVCDIATQAGIENNCVVVGSGVDKVCSVLPAGFDTVNQPERKGTGHAVMMAAKYIQAGEYENVAVLCGDAPLLSSQDLRDAYNLHVTSQNAVTVLSATVENPNGYGRILRDGDIIKAIIEQGDADEQTKNISEINSGAYWFDAKFLLGALSQLGCDNAGGEYYLTDTIEIAIKENKKTGGFKASPTAVLGANNRRSLQALGNIARSQVFDGLMEEGVNIPLADGIIIGRKVKVGMDTTILPGTIIKGNSVIGAGCEIGPNSYIENAVVGDGCKIISTTIDSSVIKNNVKIGPMSNIRPNCVVEDGAKIGDFVELKNSTIGQSTAVAHLTYVGDSDVGSGCNFGCGVVTVNYDGNKKYRTIIGNDVFIGCNTNLVAPVKLGDRVYCAAGTTVTDDVPDDALVIGRAKQYVKKDWAKTAGRFKKK